MPSVYGKNHANIFVLLYQIQQSELAGSEGVFNKTRSIKRIISLFT